MSWTNEDGRHEGYAAHILRDGREAACCTSAAGMHLDHSAEWDPDLYAWVGGEVVPWTQLLGWEARCSCGWVGPMWRRPAGADLQDAEELNLGLRDDRTVEDAVHAAWKEHIAAEEAWLQTGRQRTDHDDRP